MIAARRQARSLLCARSSPRKSTWTDVDVRTLSPLKAVLAGCGDVPGS